MAMTNSIVPAVGEEGGFSLLYRRAEVLQKEDTEQMILEIREELIDEALRIGYERYMDRQAGPFVAHCAAQAWLKLIDWHFYKHDPGEDPSAHPPCFIPKRIESWTPDQMPEPSPKDSWGKEDLNVVEEVLEETLRKWPSLQSIDLPVVEEIPRESWFPGKVLLPGYMDDESYYDTITFDESASSDMATESELLQKVTNYSPAETSIKESATMLTLASQKGTTPDTELQSSLQGGGDSTPHHAKSKSLHPFSVRKSHHLAGHYRPCTSMPPELASQRQKGTSGTATTTEDTLRGRGDAGTPKASLRSHNAEINRSRHSLPPLTDSRSKPSVISDCRLRSLRLDTQYEVSSENIDSAPKVNAKRK